MNILLILWHKIACAAAAATPRTLLIWMLEWLAICSVTAFLVEPRSTLIWILSVAGAADWLLPKFLACLLVIKHRVHIVKMARALARPRGETEAICGIPKDELCHFIFESGGFRIQEAKQKLGISRKRYDRLADALEQSGILRRGENNARVLNSAEFSRQQVYDMLRRAQGHQDLRKNLRVFAGGQRQHSAASPADIQNELRAGFSVRTL